MIKIGMMIGERYEIIEKIGTGGMSDVYKAKCHKLNRFVAIKVLKQEFSENTNFVSKFRVEAQAAAGLMHASIVNVYDVGEENGIYYIVMELVEGITLKKYIEKKARLSVKEAVSIAIQVALGIEAAHNNHIIHRDIKPQNIIISKEGRVKVTDFGIAKAATSNTITSNVMGSVHYTSPEQARGGYSDAKSDIYSLGVTLFEMLTGRVPFNGETTVAIAIKHIQEDMPLPRDFVSEIPMSVEQIVLKCTQKSPDRRYHTVAELVDDLKKSLISPDDDFVKMVDMNQSGQTKMISDLDLRKIKENDEYLSNDLEPVIVRKTNSSTVRNQKGNQQSRQQSNQQVRQQGNQKNRQAVDEYDPKMERITTVLMVVAAVIIGCVVLYIIGNVMGIFPLKGTTNLQDKKVETPTKNPEATKEPIKTDENMIEIPAVTGLMQAEATQILEQKAFKVEIEKSYSSTIAKGNVIQQTPAAGNSANIESVVTILISLGKNVEEVIVPNITDKTVDEAKIALDAVGLKLRNVDEENNDQYAVGKIFYQSYSASGSVDKGTEIDVKVSKGPELAFYSFSKTVEAPNDIDYKGGDATVVLIGSDGSIIWKSASPTVFPVNINMTGIQNISSGKIIVSYKVTITSQIIDANGNSTTQSTEEARSAEESVVFVKE